MPTATHHQIIVKYDDATQSTCFDTLLSTVAAYDTFATKEVRQEETTGWVYPSGVKTFNPRRKVDVVTDPIFDASVTTAVADFRTCIGSVAGDGIVNHWFFTVNLD